MRLEYDLTIEQTQKLSMTPELIQAIQILQFNTQELDEFVHNEVMENPVLEIDSQEEKSGENANDSLKIHEDIRLNEKSVNDKHLELQREREKEFIERVKEAEYDDISYRQWEYSADNKEFSFEDFITEDETLEEILMDQLLYTKLKPIEFKIGEYIIEAIDDNGYLTISIEDIALIFNVTTEVVENVLDVVQTFEPTGVGARNLCECLEIQLAAKGLLTDEIEYIINNKLEELANNKIVNIGKEVSLTPSEVQEVCDLIKTLEPKPGRQYSNSISTKYVVADIIVDIENDQCIVSSNDESMPRLMISSYYNTLQGQAKEDEELNKYLSNKFNSAIWLIKSIEQRKQTVFNVASAIVEYQKDFFLRGKKTLQPLTLKQIAESVGVHESTISRTVNGKYLSSPVGIYELKYFFTTGISSNTGENISSSNIKLRIKDIINNENTKKPYSDQEIVELLSNENINISRRTVAKYREGLGIQSSSKRKRY